MVTLRLQFDYSLCKLGSEPWVAFGVGEERSVELGKSYVIFIFYGNYAKELP